MEEFFHPDLKILGERIKKVRKEKGMTQIDFYRFLFPDENIEEENIKKKMNSLENGKGKKLDFNLYSRLHDKLELSFDYLMGYEIDYPNYENKAVCEYTGLSPATIEQLHFWNNCITKEMTSSLVDSQTETLKEHKLETTRKNEASWILRTIDLLFEKKTGDEVKAGISDLSLLYDLYMLSVDVPEKVSGIITELGSAEDEYQQIVTLASDNITFTDSMGEVHNINMKELNKQIWQQRLLTDVNDFINNITKKDFEN